MPKGRDKAANVADQLRWKAKNPRLWYVRWCTYHFAYQPITPAQRLRYYGPWDNGTKFRDLNERQQWVLRHAPHTLRGKRRTFPVDLRIARRVRNIRQMPSWSKAFRVRRPRGKGRGSGDGAQGTGDATRGAR